MSKLKDVVSLVIDYCLKGGEFKERWLSLVAARVAEEAPVLSNKIIAYLGVEVSPLNLLQGLSIGEVGVCYEAGLAELDKTSRKSSGQFFTPDDAARFIAEQTEEFPEGSWLDVACGVGNLSWYLVEKNEDPEEFLSNNLGFLDSDLTALMTAVSLLSSRFLSIPENFDKVLERVYRRDFLSDEQLPIFDYVIMNPPYAFSSACSNYESSKSQDLYAFFLEKVAKNFKGVVSVTPSSFLNGAKYSGLRTVLSREFSGGRIFTFDNMPDTFFRGFKYGSVNTGVRNYVRAAVVSAIKGEEDWIITPILRWPVSSRKRMFEGASKMLSPLWVSPAGFWGAPLPGMSDFWSNLMGSSTQLKSLLSSKITEYSLNVPLTPRYFISATYRDLERSSTKVLYFPDEESRGKAAMVLNSPLAYLWWRVLGGGITLSHSTLLSTPIPDFEVSESLLEELRKSEEDNLVSKSNAGKLNENVKHPEELVRSLGEVVIPDLNPKLVSLAYSNNCFDSSFTSFL